MDSTLAVQQYIQQQIRREPSNIDLILTPPEAQDEGVWKYEHLRLISLNFFQLLLYLAYGYIKNVFFSPESSRSV